MAGGNFWGILCLLLGILVAQAHSDGSSTTTEVYGVVETNSSSTTELPTHVHEEEEEEEDKVSTWIQSCNPIDGQESSLRLLLSNRFYSSYSAPEMGAKFKYADKLGAESFEEPLVSSSMSTNLSNFRHLNRFHYVGPFKCPEGRKVETGNVYTNEDEFLFTNSGHLGVMSCNEGIGKIVNSWYDPHEYCVERSRDGFAHFVKYCEDPPPSPQHQVRQMVKCCIPGFAINFNGTNYNCIELKSNESGWSPTYYDSKSVNKGRCLKLSEQKIYTRLQTRVTRRNKELFHCPYHDYKPRVTIVTRTVNETGIKTRNRWRILDNGSQIEYHLPLHGGLLWGTWSTAEDGAEDVWCYDKFFESSKNSEAASEVAYHLSTRPDIHQHYECGPLTYKNYNWTGEELKPNCSDEVHHEGRGPQGVTVFYISMFIMALVPLMLTLIAYWITWSSQNLHGWTVFSHIFSIFFMDIFLGAAMLISAVCGDVNRTFKIVFGVSAHFFTIATFMWLTMINFDLWWTFRKLKSSQMDKGLDRFAVYSLLAWGVPVVFVTVGLVMDSQYGDFGYDSDCDIRVPMYGRNFVLARSAEGIYMYFPLAVLMIMNCVFFFSTCTKIYSPKCKRKGMLHKQAGLDRQSVELFLKLFVVMGCTLTADAISWSLMPDTESLEEFPWPVIFFDAFNILGRAFLIFIIFACKPQVSAKVQKILFPGRSTARSTFRRPSSSGKFSTQDTTDRDQSRIKMQVIA